MIKKLEIKTVPVPNNSALVKNVGMDNESLFDKINELVDVVNALIKENNIHEKQVDELQMKKTSDPFAEQRKWIGKLCWFWDNKKEDGFYCVLGRIDKDDEYPYVRQGYWDARYKHCEPVSEDLIYKGGDNE